MPGWELCVGIAKALNVRPEVAFRKAGLLPPVPAAVAQEEELVHIYRELPAGPRATVLHMLRGVAREAGIPAGVAGSVVERGADTRQEQILLESFRTLPDDLREMIVEDMQTLEKTRIFRLVGEEERETAPAAQPEV